MADDNQDRIDNYVDRTGWASDTKFVLEQINIVYNAFTKLGEIKVGLGNVSGLAGITPLAKEATAQVEKITTATTKLNEEQKKSGAGNVQLAASYRELVRQLADVDKEKQKLAKDIELVSKAFTEGRLTEEEYTDRLADIRLEMGKLDVSSKLIEKALSNIEKSSQATGGSLDELRAQLALAKQAFDAMSDSEQGSETGKELLSRIRELQTAIKIQVSGVGEQTEAQKELDRAYAANKISLQEYNKELKQQAALENASTGSIEEARAKVALLNTERNKLNLTTEEGVTRQKSLNEEIDKLNDFIKTNVDSLSAQKINVGNYTGSAKIIVDALKSVETEISNLQAKQSELQKRTVVQGFGKGPVGPSGPSVDPKAQAELEQTTAQIGFLTEKAKALQAVTDNPQFLNVAGKVGDARKEIGFFTKQLIALEDAGQGNSQEFKDLQLRLAQLTDQVADTKGEIKALSSDTRSFDLFAGSVTFAADAFQTFAGAAVLAGASEEDAAEATKVLTAVQSVSNGVKGIANELTTKGTAANKVFAFVQGLVATSLDRTAAAGKRAQAALGLLGIAVTVIGVLVIAFAQLSKAMDESAQKRKIFNDIQKKAIEGYAAEVSRLEVLKKVILDQSLAVDKRKTAVGEYNKLADEGNKIDAKTIDNAALIEATINRQIELIKKRGLARAAETVIAEKAEALFLAQLELEDRFPDFGEKAVAGIQSRAQAIVDAQAKLKGIKGGVKASELLAFVDLPDDQLKAAASKSSKVALLLDAGTRNIILGLKKQQDAINDARENVGGGKAGLSVLVDDIEAKTKELDQATKIGLSFIGDVGGQLDAPSGGGNVDDKKDQLAKDRLELFKFQQGLIIEENKKIAELETLSAPTRIAALKKVAEAEKNIILAQSAFDITQNGITEVAKQTISEKSINDRLKAEERLEDGIKSINANVFKKIEEDRLSTIRKSADQELSVLAEKRAEGLISVEQFENEKKRITLDALQESLDVQVDYYNSIIRLQQSQGIDTTESRNELAKLKKQIEDLGLEKLAANEKKQIDDLKKNQEERLSIIQISADEELTVLADKRAQGLISADKFENEKKKVTLNALKETIDAQIDYYDALLRLQESQKIDTTESRKELAKLKKQLAELGIDEAVEKFNGLEKALTKLSEIYSKVTDVISGALNVSATKQKNAIEEEIALLEQKAAKEIELIEQTAASKEEAADRVAVVEARAAQQKLILERRQREIDVRRAQFEKAANIGKIIIEGALAVTKQLSLGNILGAFAVGALAAAQLAIAIATPIPKFKEGKGQYNNYEGPAIVGDGGRSELIERADGSMEVTPDKSTLTWVDRDDVIHPDAEQALKAAAKNNAAFENKEISKEQYDHEAQRIRGNVIKDSLLAQIRYYDNILKSMDVIGNDDTRKSLANIRKEIAPLEINESFIIKAAGYFQQIAGVVNSAPKQSTSSKNGIITRKPEPFINAYSKPIMPEIDLALQIARSKTDNVLAHVPDNTTVVGMEPVTNEIKSLKKELVKTIKNKTENHFHSPNQLDLIMKKNGNGATMYL